MFDTYGTFDRRGELRTGKEHPPVEPIWQCEGWSELNLKYFLVHRFPLREARQGSIPFLFSRLLCIPRTLRALALLLNDSNRRLDNDAIGMTRSMC